MTATFVASCRKYFRCPKLYSKLIGLELLIISITSEKPKIEVHIFDRATQVLLCGSLEQNKILIQRNRYFYLLNWDPVCLKIKKHDLFSMKKIFIQKIFVAFKLSAFCFEISSLSSPGCCISFILHLLLLVCGIQSMAQFYRCVSIEARVQNLVK